MPGPRSLRRIAAGLVAVATLVGGLWYGLVRETGTFDPPDAAPDDTPPPDLRAAFPTPFRNVRPGVRYVGDAACATCHPGVAETFHAHPMGRSAELVGRATPVERYDASAKNPFTASGVDPTGVDYAIVNPKHLPADLRADVCRQCHLQGVERVVRRGRDPLDYRPGLPWDQYVTTYIRRPEESDYRKSVGQFEQMETSRCFTGSEGQLSCTSCHDPHVKPAPVAADGFYRGRCLSCHESRGCSAPEPERQARDDSCIACHMPKADSSNIAHAAIIDHRVRRRPGADPRPLARPTAGAPFVPYPPGPHAPSEAERDRDWAIAAGHAVGENPAARSLGRPAAEQLTAALARWPSDSEAWAMLASVRGAAGDGPGAVEAAQAAVAAAPTRSRPSAGSPSKRLRPATWTRPCVPRTDWSG